MNRPDPEIHDLRLERYLLGELPPAEAQALQRRIEADPDLARRLESLRQTDAEILKKYPAPWMARRVELRVQGEKAVAAGRNASRWLVALACVSMGIAVPLFVAEDGPPAGVLLKGEGPQLVLYRQTPDGSERLADGDTARAGDRIQIGYQAAGRAYGAVFSLDGDGVLTQHLPAVGTRAADLGQDGRVFLEFSYELDAAPLRERFFLVARDSAFDVESLRSALREAATAQAESLNLAPVFDQVSLTLVKE